MLDTISLFTGAGGLDLGLHAAGFTIRAVVECDEDALRTLALNQSFWDTAEIFPLDIKVVVEDRSLPSGAGLKKGEAALLIGGPPCQPFSKSGFWHSGDSRRLKDPRADTLRQYFQVLEDCLPKVFLLENVPGISFSNKSDGMQFVEEQVKGINRRARTRYRITSAQLNAVRYGVPQMRERVFVVGHREGERFEFPRYTHTKPSPVDMSNGIVDMDPPGREGDLDPYLTAWDAIGHLAGQNDSSLEVGGKYGPLLPSIPEGHNYLFHTNRGKGKEIFAWRSRYWSMLLKLAKGRPSWTLTAQPGPAIGPFHWENRRLSRDELCALQTFPPDYQISGGLMAAYRQLGNAVPSALAELLGLEIRRQFFGESNLSAVPSLLPAKRFDTPGPEVPGPLPSNWRKLRSERLEDHPGTGKGPGTMRRASAEA